MKLKTLITVAVVAAGVATIVVQRERLRELDRAEMRRQLRSAVESRAQPPGRAIDETIANSIGEAVNDVMSGRDTALNPAT